MSGIQYEVQPRPSKAGTLYALNRRGIKGGLKNVTVYVDENVALSVCATLNAARSQEVSGR